MKKISYFGFFILCLFFGSFPNTASATDTTTDYTVSIAPTANQIEGVSSYFNLRLAPGQKDRLPVTIANKSEEEATFSIQFHTAATNSNGIVDYTLKDVTLSGEPNINIRDLVTIESKEVTIPAASQQTVYVEITMPTTSFDGILLGGIQIAKKADDANATQIMVANQYQYVIAVQVTQTETKVTPKLVGGKVTLTQENAYNAVTMSIQNTTATLLTKMTGTFTIKEKGSNKVIVNETKKNLSIAPNHSFTLQTLFGQKFSAGKYTYTIKLNNTDEEWVFSKDFSISKKEENQYNTTSVDKTEATPPWLYLTIGMGIVILILLLIILFLWLQRNKKPKA
jgi:hypothetical protein